MDDLDDDLGEWDNYWALRAPLSVHLTHNPEEQNRRHAKWQELYELWSQWLLQTSHKANLQYWIRNMKKRLAYFDHTAYSHPILNSSPIFLTNQEEQDYHWYKFTIKRMQKRLEFLSRV